MKKSLSVLGLVLLFSALTLSQKLPKPKQMPGPATAEQTKIIQQGIALHDAKKYDEAIAKYQAVLAENPDSTLALYELTLSYFDKGEKSKAKETAFRGANYLSDELPLFYGMIGNCLDDEGKPEEAIKMYRDAEDILRSYPDMKRHLSSIYYNLGVTYVRQKKYNEARVDLKKAVENNFAYASPHYLLSIIYEGTKYKIPAFVTAVRLISLEPNTQRTKRAADIFAKVLKPAGKDPATGNINIFVDLNAPKDEGDFGMFDLLLGTLTTVRGEEDKNKSDSQMFVEAIDSVIAILSEDKKIASTFVGKQYVPFLLELKKNGHTEALGNAVLYINDNNNADAAKWIKANESKLSAFLKWGKEYRQAAR